MRLAKRVALSVKSRINTDLGTTKKQLQNLEVQLLLYRGIFQIDRQKICIHEKFGLPFCCSVLDSPVPKT